MSASLQPQPEWALGEAAEDDLPGILGIVNDVIAHTTAIYTDQPETLEQRRAWMRYRQALGYPVLVARGPGRGAGGILGFASFTDFRSGWSGHRHSVEHSVHVHADARGQGVGQALVLALVGHARQHGKHVMIASVDGDNTASLALHAKLGFSRVARLPQVACKFGRWLDMVMLQIVLDEAPPR